MCDWGNPNPAPDPYREKYDREHEKMMRMTEALSESFRHLWNECWKKAPGEWCDKCLREQGLSRNAPRAEEEVKDE